MTWIVWLIMAVIVAMIASKKERSAGGWFLYGLLIWPIALVHILLTDSPKPTVPLSAADIIARLAELEKLKESGAVTEQEYARLRSEIQVQQPQQTPPAPAVRTCGKCGKEMEQGVLICPHCNTDRKLTIEVLSGLAKVMGVVLFIFLIGHFASSSEKPPAPPSKESSAYIEQLRKEGRVSEHKGSITILEKPEASQTPSTPADNWSYVSNTDEMTSKPVRFAQVVSTNKISLDSPYEGAQHGKLELRTHPRHGKDVILSIDRGQFLCHTYDCSVTVRFDEKSPVQYSAAEPADYSNNILFIQNYSRFVGELQKAKKLRISTNFYQNGMQVFEFDVAGFDADEYLGKTGGKP